MHSITPAAASWSTLDPWTGGAVLVAMSTLFWGLKLLRQLHDRYERILIGLVGIVATYQGLHLAMEPRGWAWFADALGVVLCLTAMAMLARLARSHRNAKFALRLSEAREHAVTFTQKNLEPAPLASAAAAAAQTRPDVPKTILESAPMAMFAIGLDGSVNFWNPAAERMLGWSSAEVLGNHMPNLISHSGGLYDAGPIKLVRKDGAEILGPVQSVPVRDSRGVVSGILTIVTQAAQS